MYVCFFAGFGMFKEGFKNSREKYCAMTKMPFLEKRLDFVIA